MITACRFQFGIKTNDNEDHCMMACLTFLNTAVGVSNFATWEKFIKSIVLQIASCTFNHAKYCFHALSLNTALTVDNRSSQDCCHASLLREELDVGAEGRWVRRLLLHHSLLVGDEAEWRRELGHRGGGAQRR